MEQIILKKGNYPKSGNTDGDTAIVVSPAARPCYFPVFPLEAFVAKLNTFEFVNSLHEYIETFL